VEKSKKVKEIVDIMPCEMLNDSSAAKLDDFQFLKVSVDLQVVVISTVRRPFKIYLSSWPSSFGLRACRRTYVTILKRAWSANFKMVWYAMSSGFLKLIFV
jgi:hypothetical protein